MSHCRRVMAIKIRGWIAGDEILQKIPELEEPIEASVSFQQCACRNKHQRKVALRLFRPSEIDALTSGCQFGLFNAPPSVPDNDIR